MEKSSTFKATLPVTGSMGDRVTLGRVLATRSGLPGRQDRRQEAGVSAVGECLRTRGWESARNVCLGDPHQAEGEVG